MSKGFPRRFFALAALAAVLVTAGLGCGRKEAVPDDGPVEQWTDFTSSRFRVSFKHPASWRATAGQTEDDSLEGATGFVFLSGIDGRPPSVVEAVLSETTGQRMPYGTKPVVVSTRVDGQEGRLVMPSSDQPAEMRGRAMLMLKYPKPVPFSTESYHYLAVYADKDHIQRIMRTLRFLEAGEAARGAVAGAVTIGPLCPVDEVGKPCAASPEAYAARKIVVYLADGATKVKEGDIDAKGLYRVELNAGTYVVDINHAGLDRSEDVPRTVTIEAGRTTLLDIAIDTGIR